MVRSRPDARPLVQAVACELARRGAYALLQIDFGPYATDLEWAKVAPLDLVETLAPAQAYVLDSLDAWIGISAPERPHEGADLPAESEQALHRAYRQFSAKRLSFEVPWVGCRFPTQTQADEAGMTLAEFTDFLYGACLLDWDAEAHGCSAT